MNKNKLKSLKKHTVGFLITISVFLLSSNISVAALQVKGTMPEVQPLQPVPVGVGPNVSGNVQYEPTNWEGSGDNAEAGGNNQHPENSQANQTINGLRALARQRRATLNWPWVVLFLVGGGFLAFIIWRNGKQN